MSLTVRKLLAIAALLVFGVVRWPFEVSLNIEQKAAHFHKAALTLGLRERVGQMGFLAALSGFRSPLAAFLWIQAHAAWEKTEWGRMAGIFDTVTTLQPRSILYWDMAAWHMSYNAGVAALEDPKQPSEALRLRAQRQYLNIGKDMLERGIVNNPDRYLLYERLATLLREKFEDHCGAAAAYMKAMQFPEAPPYLGRFAGYELSKCPEKQKEAYELLLSLYKKGKDERLPTLVKTLQDLEEKLNIPQDQRIDKVDKE